MRRVESDKTVGPEESSIRGTERVNVESNTDESCKKGLFKCTKKEDAGRLERSLQ